MRKILGFLLLIIGLLSVMLFGCTQASFTDESSIGNTTPEKTEKEETAPSAKNKSEAVTEGTENYRGFVIDNVLHSDNDSDIHYNVYIPDSYDGTTPFALYFTLPGYEGLYFQGVAQNLKSKEFGFEAQKYNGEMIIVAPQLSDWEETSANQTIALVEYFLENYNIDRSKVYANGFLSAKYDKNSNFEPKTDYRSAMPQFTAEGIDKNADLLELLHQIAKEKEATPAQVSLAWMLCKKPYIVPIPGTRNTERLSENAGAAEVTLSTEEVKKLDIALDAMEMSEVFGGSKIQKSN